MPMVSRRFLRHKLQSISLRATTERAHMAARKQTPADIRLDLNERLAYRFNRLAGQQLRCLAEMFRPRFKLTLARWKVLSVIGFFSSLSSTEVARHTSLGADKISRTSDQLVRMGLVVRRTDPSDRRRVMLSLSAKGKRINDEIERVRWAIEIELLGALTPRERALHYAVLDKLDERAATIFSGKQSWQSIVDRADVPVASRRKKRAG
jgi:DNA-binding MarR family transcriptional regulator